MRPHYIRYQFITETPEKKIHISTEYMKSQDLGIILQVNGYPLLEK